ncbi:hypothetical protein TGP89_265840B, partial [Toxoplasma gondii p89]
ASAFALLFVQKVETELSVLRGELRRREEEICEHMLQLEKVHVINQGLQQQVAELLSFREAGSACTASRSSSPQSPLPENCAALPAAERQKRVETLGAAAESYASEMQTKLASLRSLLDSGAGKKDLAPESTDAERRRGQATESQALHDELERMKKQLEAAEKRLAETKMSRASVDRGRATEVTTLEAQLAAAEEKLTSLADESREKEAQVEAHAEKAESLERLLQAARKEKDALEQANAELERRTREAESETKSKVEAMEAELKKEMEKREKEMEKRENELKKEMEKREKELKKEMEKREKELKKEVEKREKELKKEMEKREKEVTQKAKELCEAQEAFRRTREEDATAGDERISLETAKVEAEGIRRAAAERQAALEAEVASWKGKEEELRQRFAAAVETHTKEIESAVSAERAEHLREKAQLQAVLSEANARLAERAEEVCSLEARVEKLQMQLENARLEQEEAQARFSADRAEEEAKAKQRDEEKESLAREVAALKATERDEINRAVAEERAAAAEDRQNSEKMRTELRRLLAETEDRLEETQAKLVALQKQVAETQPLLVDLQLKVNVQREEIQTLTREKETSEKMKLEREESLQLALEEARAQMEQGERRLAEVKRQNEREGLVARAAQLKVKMLLSRVSQLEKGICQVQLRNAEKRTEAEDVEQDFADAHEEAVSVETPELTLETTKDEAGEEKQATDEREQKQATGEREQKEATGEREQKEATGEREEETRSRGRRRRAQDGKKKPEENETQDRTQEKGEKEEKKEVHAVEETMETASPRRQNVGKKVEELAFSTANAEAAQEEQASIDGRTRARCASPPESARPLKKQRGERARPEDHAESGKAEEPSSPARETPESPPPVSAPESVSVPSAHAVEAGAAEAGVETAEDGTRRVGRPRRERGQSEKKRNTDVHSPARGLRSSSDEGDHSASPRATRGSHLVSPSLAASVAEEEAARPGSARRRRGRGTSLDKASASEPFRRPAASPVKVFLPLPPSGTAEIPGKGGAFDGSAEKQPPWSNGASSGEDEPAGQGGGASRGRRRKTEIAEKAEKETRRETKGRPGKGRRQTTASDEDAE